MEALKTPSLLKKLPKPKESSCQSRGEPVKPCPDTALSTEKFRRFGRVPPCFKERDSRVIVNEETTSKITDIDGNEAKSRMTAKKSQHSLKPRCENPAKQKLSLEDLKRTSPPGFEEFEAAVAWKELDEETALMLWEDIFKPISSHFKSLQGD